jgi:hypothetical protein
MELAASQAVISTTARRGIVPAIEYNPKLMEAWVNLGLIGAETRKRRSGPSTATFAVLRRNPTCLPPHHGPRPPPRRSKETFLMPRSTIAPHSRGTLDAAPARINLGRLLFQRSAFELAREQFLRLTEVAPESTKVGSLSFVSLLRLSTEAEAAE